MMLKCSPEAFAKCPTHQYCGNSAADCDFTEGSDCDKFNQKIASQPVPSCGMCTNATTDPELTPDNDLSYVGIGDCEDGHRLLFKSGDRTPTEIYLEKYFPDRGGWHIIGIYRPQYCPNCGRKLIENDRWNESRNRQQKG